MQLNFDFVKNTTQKILVIRFSSIGDIVLTSLTIRCLKQQLGAEIHFLTKQAFYPLLEANPYIDKIFTIEEKVSEVLTGLKKENYDCIVDLHKNLRSLQVRLTLGVKTFTFNKLNFRKWLLVNFKINLLPDKHIADRYLEAVAPLGVQNDGLGLDYFLPFRQTAISLPESPYYAFAIGAAHGTKKLPVEKIIEICKDLTLPVILLGGKEEKQQGEIIAKASGPHVQNYCGRLSLHESAAVIRSAGKVITHDTGMMHIAAAFQKEILSIWGNTVPSFGMYPYFGKEENKNTIFEVKNLPCRPCSKIGYAKCPLGHFRCMNLQETGKITGAASR